MISIIRTRDDLKSPPLLDWLAFACSGLLIIAFGIYAFTLMDAQPTHWEFLTTDDRIFEYIGYTLK